MKNEILVQKVCSIFTQMLFDNLKHVNVSNMQKKNILKRKNQQGANTFNSLRFFFSLKAFHKILTPDCRDFVFVQPQED